MPTNAVSGLVKLQQGGLWSNAVSFRVPAPPGSASVLAPNAVSLVVGETRTLQALDDNGQPITGAAWASTDTDIVSLSSADPPVLTAVAPGTATITVGSASAEVSVYAGSTLPNETVVWANGASTQGGLYPAVPNYDAVADVFAIGGNNEVVAIKRDGSTAWTYQGASFPWLFPDFQGGAVLYDNNEVLTRLDPLTGAPLQLFSYTSSHAQQFGYAEPRIHPDGTVFTTDYACTSADCTGGTDNETRAWVVGVDNRTAAAKFRVPLENWTDTTTIAPADQLFCQASGDAWTGHAWPQSFSAIVAGDGRYYVGYTTKNWTGTVQRSPANLYADAAYNLWDQLVAYVVNSELTAARTAHGQLRAATGESYTSWDSQLDDYLDRGDRTSALSLLNLQNLKYKRLCDSTLSSVLALRVMQVGADGSSSDVVVKTWETTDVTTYIRSSGSEAPWGYRQTLAHTGPKNLSLEGLNFITDEDQGALASWVAIVQCPVGAPGTLILVNTCVPATDHHLTSLRNGALASDVVWDQPGNHAVQLDLQLEDGSFVGTQSDATYTNTTMMAFTATGATKWMIPGYEPQQTAAAGGLIAMSGAGTYELSASGALVRPVAAVSSNISWSGDAYSGLAGVVEAVELPGVQRGTSYAAMKNGYPSSFKTFVGVTTTPGGAPAYAMQSWGPSCVLGSNQQPPLTSGAAFNQYAASKQALLSSGAISSSATNSCSQFFAAHQDTAPFFHLLDVAVNRTDPRDGPKSTMSRWDAGVAGLTQMSSLLAARVLMAAPVCQIFIIDPRHPNDRTVAASQGVARPFSDPAKDIYLNTDPLVVPLIKEATVLHEALHSLTNRDDDELRALLRTPNVTGKSHDINIQLVQAGCAAN